jgi:predicted MPP superfamily phosphohydrolase
MERRHSTLFGAGLLAGAGALAYAAAVEPYWIDVPRLELFTPRLPEAYSGYTIYIVSDLHTRRMGRRERSVAAILRDLPPADLVAVTGDMVHTRRGIDPFLEIAQSFKATDGVYAVFGNSEHKNGVRPHELAGILQQHGITPLLNRHAILTRGAASIALVGTDDPCTNRDHLTHALAGVPDELFTLALMHSPDSIAEAVLRGVDVVLSGHTHGGQIRFPITGAPFTHSWMGGRMSSGYYAGRRLRMAIGIRPGRTQLYVTRGIGVSGVALRFLCRPELTVLTLRRGYGRMKRVG